MTTVSSIMKQLESLGSEQIRKIFARHGAGGDSLFGVRIADLKKVLKTIKGQQELALELYATGNYDAMYLAGMAADGAQMTKKQLQDWARQATWEMISEYTVPGVAAESEHACDLANKWIDARKEHVAAAGWATWSAIVAVWPDEELDLGEIEALLNRVLEDIEGAPNRVRYTMNGFVISVGSYVKPLHARAKATARKLGTVDVDMGATSCKVPLATDTIQKVVAAGRVGKKRKTAKC